MLLRHLRRNATLISIAAAIALGSVDLLAQGDSEMARKAASQIVVKIQRADYEGDRAALNRLDGELLPFLDQPAIRARIRYWRGFAKWRRAINGANESPTPTDLVQDLADGEAEFAAALELDPNFVDAKVGAASCAILRLFFEGTFTHTTDTATLRAVMEPPGRLLKEAQQMASDNPRLLWVIGQNQWSIGSQDAALETYERGLKSARAQRTKTDDPLEPSWGEPELLMNFAWSNLHRAKPDPEAAERYARAALGLVPEWHYVRDILLPQIQDAKVRP